MRNFHLYFPSDGPLFVWEMQISCIRHSAVGLAGFHTPILNGSEIGQVSEGEDGRKTGDVGERDRVEVFCGKCGNM